jgi:hypothetical protein
MRLYIENYIDRNILVNENSLLVYYKTIRRSEYERTNCAPERDTAIYRKI